MKKKEERNRTGGARIYKEGVNAGMDYIGYIRVTPAKGLTAEEDLARQREELAWWIGKSGGQQIGEYIVEDRAKEGVLIAEALKDCRKRKARLVIPSLIRTGQAKDLMDALIGARMQFVVIHVMNEPTRRLIDTLNASAKREQEKRSKRAKDSAKVGNPHGTRKDGTPALSKEAREKGRAAAAKVKHEKANDFVLKVQPTIKGMRAAGLTMYAIAKDLNQRRVKTASGTTGNWTVTKVARVLAWKITEPYKLEENFRGMRTWKAVRIEQAWLDQEKEENRARAMSAAYATEHPVSRELEIMKEVDRLSAVAAEKDKAAWEKREDGARHVKDTGIREQKRAIELLGGPGPKTKHEKMVDKARHDATRKRKRSRERAKGRG